MVLVPLVPAVSCPRLWRPPPRPRDRLISLTRRRTTAVIGTPPPHSPELRETVRKERKRLDDLADGSAVIAPFAVASIMVRNDSGREFITVDT
jgi:hypothetical protein